MKQLGSYIALIGADAAPFADALAAHCADVLLLPSCSLCDRRIACHPDTLMAQLDDVLVTSAAYAEEAAPVLDALTARTDCRIVLSARIPGKTYPADVGCNVLVRSDHVYGLLSHLWPEVIETAVQQGRVLHSVRQGYAGCCALAAGNLVISADPSILRAASSDGAPILPISSDGIRLPGYSGGFIGGAAGVCADTALFFGGLEHHPDGQRIRAALEAQGMESISLSDAPLCDYGGIRFVKIGSFL